MKSGFESKFIKLLQEQIEDGSGGGRSGGRSGGSSGGRPRYDRGGDTKSFKDSLSPDTDPEFADSDGMGDDFYSQVDETSQQIIEWADDLKTFSDRLIDPNNPESLLKKLASVATIPEFSSAAESVSKHLKKCVESAGAARAELDVLATLAGTRRDARKAVDSSQSGASGPY